MDKKNTKKTKQKTVQIVRKVRVIKRHATIPQT